MLLTESLCVGRPRISPSSAVGLFGSQLLGLMQLDRLLAVLLKSGVLTHPGTNYWKLT
jgi:hypothetical protein